ncbi:hypothetical protein OSTOST_07603 [Ostertagia ostertagi]
MVSACFVRSWSMSVVILYLPSVLIERAFASKYISDYEKVSRPWIYRVIIPSNYIAAILMVLPSMLGFSNGVATTISIGTFFVIYSMAYVTLFRRDSVKLRDINSGARQKANTYSLSTKFQLRENLKVMKVFLRILYYWLI